MYDRMRERTREIVMTSGFWENVSLMKRFILRDTKRNFTYAAVIVIALIVFSDIQLFVSPPSYSDLRWRDILSAPGYILCAWIVCRFYKPRN
jgi:hypothetical protein